MIHVLPQSQRGEDGIAAVNLAVAVAALRAPVVLGQRDEAVAMCGGWLRSRIAE